MSKRLWASVVVAMAVGGSVRAAEVRIAPADFIVLNPTNPNAGYSDLIVHAIGVRSSAGEHFHLVSLRVEILSEGEVRLTEVAPAARLVDDTRRLRAAPVRGFMTGQLLNADGADGFFAAPTAFAQGADLGPGEALFAVRHHYSVGFNADQVRVTAVGRDANGAAVTAEATVPVRRYTSPMGYRFPLHGVWLMQSVPAIEDHHRLNPSTEFASDYFKLDAEGRTLSGDPLDPNTAYGYGQPVSAAADGDVVMVIADQVQELTQFLPRAGETPEATGARIEATMIRRAQANFGAAEAGNIVTIRHARDGVVEYSSYGHLKAGSVTVKVGDHVVQGQVVGAVGDTGDSPVVHLHFQINAGPDPFNTKSLSFTFTDVRNTRGDSELGRLVTNLPRK